MHEIQHFFLALFIGREDSEMFLAEMEELHERRIVRMGNRAAMAWYWIQVIRGIPPIIRFWAEGKSAFAKRLALRVLIVAVSFLFFGIVVLFLRPHTTNTRVEMTVPKANDPNPPRLRNSDPPGASETGKGKWASFITAAMKTSHAKFVSVSLDNLSLTASPSWSPDIAPLEEVLVPDEASATPYNTRFATDLTALSVAFSDVAPLRQQNEDLLSICFTPSLMPEENFRSPVIAELDRERLYLSLTLRSDWLNSDPLFSHDITQLFKPGDSASVGLTLKEEEPSAISGTPEPSSLLLIGIGAGIMLVRRKRATVPEMKVRFRTPIARS